MIVGIGVAITKNRPAERAGRAEPGWVRLLFALRERSGVVKAPARLVARGGSRA